MEDKQEKGFDEKPFGLLLRSRRSWDFALRYYSQRRALTGFAVIAFIHYLIIMHKEELYGY
jgi:hypothetical protein